MSRESLSQLARAGRTIHVVGIGGAGMSGIALLMQARGAKVTGSDREASQTTEDLARQGVTVHIGHDAAQVVGPAAVVYTAAAPPDNPELLEARQRGIPVIKRSEALGELVNDVEGHLIAVAGTHGKTTTTALTAVAIEGAGGDPTALVGGRVSAWGGNARIGEGDIYVVEADEYDRSFLTLRPSVAVVTSVEAEHLDTYATLEEMETAFASFVDSVPEDGHLVACADDPGAMRCLERAGVRAGRGGRGLAYGLAETAAVRAESVRYEAGRTRFSARHGEESLGDFELSLHGAHNVRNALAALGVLVALGLDPRAAAGSLAGFDGVDRRFQTLGDAAGVTVVDDYAHHPTEISATLGAARQVFAGRRIVTVFQPHLYSRTRAFAAQFGAALAGSDLVFVVPIYPAREQPIPGVTAKLVATAAIESIGGARVQVAASLDEAVDSLTAELSPGDVLLTLGAGDVDRVGRQVLDRLRRSHVDA